MSAFRLANGLQVWIRPIGPDDKAELQAGLRRLSRETIERRFLAAKPRFSSAELHYLTEIDGVNHLALAAVSLQTGHIVAVARCVRLSDRPDTAEWAIVVADALQRKGLGRHLSRLLAERAIAAGIRRFSATMQGDNVAVARLLAHMHGVVERDEVHH